MLETSLFVLIAVIAISLIFDYINGFNDAANAIATCVSTRALSIRWAIVMAVGLNFLGAMVSTKVAATIGRDIVDPAHITQLVILTGVSSAILWGLITWFFAIPSSSSHAVIGGIIGAVVAHSGSAGLHWIGIKKIVLALVLSPIIGVVVSFFMMVALLWSCRSYSPYALNKGFRWLQIISAAFVAFAHGLADAQKSMGIITMALLSAGYLSDFRVPRLVMMACAGVMALGTAMGGWRIIKTIGKDFVKLQPIHGFCVQTSAAMIILGTASFGLPTSTTHVITSAILGVGLSKRISAIDWRIAANILWAWAFTIPAAGLFSFILYTIIKAFFNIG